MALNGSDTSDMSWQIHAVVPRSAANGPGVRFTVWSQGCGLGCRGCFNPETHDLHGGGTLRTVGELVDEALAVVPGIEGVTLTGGEPLSVHVRKRLPGCDVNLYQLGKASEGFTGAELAQAVVDAMYHAFAQERDVTTEDVAAAIERTVPLSTSQREVIERLRAWLREGRALSASIPETDRQSTGHVPVEID